MVKTIVITGITGKSGQCFLNRLLLESDNLKNYKFKLVCRNLGDYSKNIEGYKLVEKAILNKKLNIELCDADLTNNSEIIDIFKESVYMVIHIASVKMTMNIVPDALKYGVDNFIMVHTTGIYSKYKAAGEEYRKIESEVEKIVQEYRAHGRDINITILRPTMVYGDLNDKNISVFIKMVDKLRIFPVVKGARFDLQPVWCKDLGDAYYDVMMNWDVTRNKEYILSGGESIQLIEIFHEIERQLGVKNVYISCPYPIAYVGACLIYFISLKKIDMREKVQRLVEPRAFSHDEALKDFGYTPVEFNEGVKEEIEMYKKLNNK